jgi:hypothetical protein
MSNATILAYPHVWHVPLFSGESAKNELELCDIYNLDIDFDLRC